MILFQDKEIMTEYLGNLLGNKQTSQKHWRLISRPSRLVSVLLQHPMAVFKVIYEWASDRFSVVVHVGFLFSFGNVRVT